MSSSSFSGRHGARMRPQAARMAEMIDLGVLRQMWRPRNFAGMEAALSRAEHAGFLGEARHPAMKRIAREGMERAAARLTAGITAALSLLTRSGSTAARFARLDCASPLSPCRTLPAWLSEGRA